MDCQKKSLLIVTNAHWLALGIQAFYGRQLDHRDDF